MHIHTPKFFNHLSATVRWSLVAFGLFFIFQVFATAYGAMSGGSNLSLVYLFAGSAHTDSEDRTNVLLMGAGGEGHPGGDLTDTLIVASYHHRDGTVAMLSIPRDLWVTVEGEGMRINAVYDHFKKKTGDSATAIDETSEFIGEMVGLQMPYYAKIDFAGFRDVVDALGGVTITAEKSIYDATYPCDDMVNFCPLRISAGTQQMDGETALKYARSRHSTSDFDRAARQQQVIEAIREKALSADILTSPRKLNRLFDAVAGNLETNFSFREMVYFGRIAEEFNRQNLISVVLSNDPTETGGLLYTPPRAEYGGASVVAPEGDDFTRIRLFANVLFGHPLILVEKRPIEVLNASGKPRVAEVAAYYLNRYGFNTAHIDNYPNREKRPETEVLFYDEAATSELRTLLRGFMNIEPMLGSPELQARGYDMTVVVGQDFDPDEYE